MKVNLKYILFILVLYFFVFKYFFETIIIIPGIGYIDEIIALSAVPLFIYDLIKKQLRIKVTIGWGIFIFLFMSIGLLGNYIYAYQTNQKIVLLDAFLCIKFWLTIYTGRSIFSNFNLPKYAKKIYFHIRLIIWVYVILIILDYILKIFPSTIRYGIRSIELFYGHPTVFVASCVFLTTILVSIRPFINHSDRYFVLLLLLQMTSLRVKAYGAILVFALIYYMVYIKHKKINLRIFFVIIPLVLIIARKQIIYYFFSSIQAESARFQLLIKSIQIANDSFPLGAGFGTFASYYSAMSTSDYSPLYYKYHLSHVYGLIKGEADFVSDSFWPMIVGQTGWIGLVLFIVSLISLIVCIQKLKYYNSSYNIGALFIIIYLMIASTAEAAFVSPVAIPFAIWLGILFSADERERNILKK